MAQTRNGRNQVEGLIETLQAYSAVNKARSDEYTRGRVRHLFQAFRELSQSLDAVEGRKDIIYLSEGFSGRYLVGATESDEERNEPAPRRDLESGRGQALRQHAAAQRADRGRRVVPPIRLRHPRGRHRRDPRRGRLGWRAQPAGPRESENALFDIAQATGGEVLRNTNDLAAQLDRVERQTSLVYVLAFRPDQAGPEGAFHELKVKVSAPGARVLARAGYYDRRGFRQAVAPRAPPAGGRRHRQRDSLRRHPDPRARPPVRERRGDSTVPVLVEIPGAPLLAADKGEKLGLEIYVYAIGPDDRLRDFFVRTICDRPARRTARS